MTCYSCILLSLNVCLCIAHTGSSFDEESWKDCRRRHHSVKEYLCTPSTVSTSQLYSCDKCGKSFLTPGGLCKHMNTHTSKYKCAICGKCFGSRADLAKHRRSRRIHSGYKPYKCRMCDKAYRGSGHLKRHMRVHTGDKPYKCEKSLNQSRSLQTRTHQEHSDRRLYRCAFCGKMYQTEIEVKRHVRIHIYIKPYSCIHCSDRFMQYRQLKRHLLESHNEGTWLVCNICRKKFVCSVDLDKHLLRHKSVKPYVCSECPKRFYTVSEMKRHQRVHSNVKSFGCILCDKSFKHKETVVQHFNRCPSKLSVSDMLPICYQLSA